LLNQSHGLLIKCADISNEARPKKVAEPWADLLLQEFYAQADKEKEQGLPVAPFMDREKVTKASAQGIFFIDPAGFIGFVLLPLIEDSAAVVPELKPLIEPIKAAKEYYLGMIQIEKEAMANKK
jgi:hypothetical protein